MKKEDKDEKNDYNLQSVANALRIMDLLSEHEQLGVAEIHKLTEQGRASIFRILYTLEAGGYVSKDEAAKYRLSNKFVHYGNVVIQRYDLVWTARPFMQKLRDQCNQTTHLSILANGKSTFLYKEGTNNAIQMRSYVGLSMEAYETATGKALLAQLEGAELNRIADAYAYNPHTIHTIGSKAQLLEQMQLIRSRGYAEDLEESEIGLTCYAAPIFDYSGKAIAAISVSGATPPMQRDRDGIIGHLLETAAELSVELGYIK